MKYKILPFFIPHKGCPHKCVFCDQKIITGSRNRISIRKISDQIQAFALNQKEDSDLQIRKEVAFYGGSFTALSHDLQRSLLKPASFAIKDGLIDGIRLSTRPDCCDLQTIRLLKEYLVQTVELGVQSMDPEVLQQSGRGHGPEESRQAIYILKSEGFSVGAQLMLGLPGEDHDSFLFTIQQIIKLKPDFVRIYPTIVIKGTYLEELYLKGKYKPLSLSHAIELCSEGKRLLKHAGIRVIRCGLQPTASLQKRGSICAGPFHPAFGELVESNLVFELVNKGMRNFFETTRIKEKLIIKSSPKLFSKLKGQKGINLNKLNMIYPELNILLISDPVIPNGFIKITDERENNMDICISKV